MAQRLTNMDITRVSLVDKGANGRAIAILKRDDSPPPAADAGAAAAQGGDSDGLVARIAKALAPIIGHRDAPAEAVAKAQTFAAIISGRELSNALYDSWYTLEDALWSAIWAVDEDGADLALEAKKELVAQNLDEFKAYLLAAMDRGVAKSARPDELAVAKRTLVRTGEVIEKVGKKVSAERLAALKTAYDALASVIAEVEDAGTTQKRDTSAAGSSTGETAPEDDMTGEELTKALKPLTDRLAEIEKRLPEQNAAATDTEEAPVAKSDDSEEATLDDVLEAIGALAGRVEKIETARGVRKSADGQEGDEPVKKSKDRGLAAALLG